MFKTKIYTYLEFPANTKSTDGMIVLQGETDKLSVKWHKNIEYIERNNQKLYLQILEPRRITDNYFAEETENSWPTVVYIPGSAWHKQDKRLNSIS
jgi:hypothetical protein